MQKVLMAGGARGATVAAVSESEGTLRVGAVDGEGGGHGNPSRGQRMKVLDFLGMRPSWECDSERRSFLRG